MTGYSLKEISTRLNTGQIPQVTAGAGVYTKAESDAALALKPNSLDLAGAIGNINSPLLDMPLKNSLAMKSGVGSATFTRASTATYIDRYGVLKTAAIDEPRFEKEGYLNEGASTNLMLNSEFDASWSVSGCAITYNNALCPDGVSTKAALLTANGGSTAYTANDSIFTSGTTYTQSFFYKAGTYLGDIRVTFSGTYFGNTAHAIFTKDGDFVSITDANIIKAYGSQKLANGWIRIWAQAICAVSGAGVIGTYLWSAVNLNAGETFYAYGAQLEALPFATSYIPTVGASVTRSADKLVVTGIGNFPDSQNFTALIDFNSFGFDTATYSPYSRLFEVAVVGGVVGIRASSSGLFYSVHGSTFVYGGFVSNLSGQPSTSKKRFATIANNGLISNAENGVLVQSSSYSNGYAPAGDINIGSDTGTGGMLFGHITNFRIYDKALSSAEVALA